MDFTDVDFWVAQTLNWGMCLLWILKEVFFSVISPKSQRNIEIRMGFMKHKF